VEVLYGLQCRGCGQCFYLCRRCYCGQAYCSVGCRVEARREQCRRSQKKYLQKLKGRQRRAAAQAAYRHRVRAGLVIALSLSIAGEESNRSGCFSQTSEVVSCQQVAFCASCGRPGWAQNGPP